MCELSNAAAATARGFEPLRAEPNGFLVHHLNHSVTLSMDAFAPSVHESFVRSCGAGEKEGGPSCLSGH